MVADWAPAVVTQPGNTGPSGATEKAQRKTPVGIVYATLRMPPAAVKAAGLNVAGTVVGVVAPAVVATPAAATMTLADAKARHMTLPKSPPDMHNPRNEIPDVTKCHAAGVSISVASKNGK